MSDFIRKIKDEAKAVSAAIDQELTVLEGVPGYDPLAHDKTADDKTADDETADDKTADDEGADDEIVDDEAVGEDAATGGSDEPRQ